MLARNSHSLRLQCSISRTHTPTQSRANERFIENTLGEFDDLKIFATYSTLFSDDANNFDLSDIFMQALYSVTYLLIDRMIRDRQSSTS